MIVVVQPMKYDAVPTSDLQALRLKMRAKIAISQNRQSDGTQQSLQRAYQRIVEAVSEDLASREGEA